MNTRIMPLTLSHPTSWHQVHANMLNRRIFLSLPANEAVEWASARKPTDIDTIWDEATKVLQIFLLMQLIAEHFPRAPP